MCIRDRYQRRVRGSVSTSAMGLCTTEEVKHHEMDTDFKPAFEGRMKQHNLSDAAQAAFLANYEKLVAGEATTVLEGSIEPVDTLENLSDLPGEIDHDLLAQAVMVKLNGGLGTGMGLEKAKSLLPVKGEDTFLDFIAKQVITQSETTEQNLELLFMNSFSTSADTLAYLSKYADALGQPVEELEFVQNKSPKVLAEDLSPATYPDNPEMEWCPPGHGDLYAALLGSGTLDRLLAAGKKFMFVSNADNLGATLNEQVLTWFEEAEAPFMMEVCERTESDKKGGHLCRDKESKRLLLRESAQCAEADVAAFQDVSLHKFFNTNNLWIKLDKLKEIMEANNGAVPLALIKNCKNVNPRDKGSPKVFQLETAMGAAVNSFEGATALLMPRSRFAPVKSCSDLLAIRSDAYVVTSAHTIELAAAREGVPPVIQLDDGYKFVDAMEAMAPGGVPSLVECTKLTVEGKIEFGDDVKIVGEVKFVNEKDEVFMVANGTYKDDTFMNK
eukprot:TRINITY_DN2383_c0_g1_i5.p1 TRINITY_DN2383_c0_g1~~TRINITY_DN2383_c0_g1_i5.p1  ORF type:complete len:500 (+),score=183.63 TRINITY_DN2383_c0_g1_i5:181-1680(+)